MAAITEVWSFSDGSRYVWDVATRIYTEFRPDGEIALTRPFDAEEEERYPSPGDAVDIVALADNLAALTEAVDFLILDSLGGF